MLPPGFEDHGRQAAEMCWEESLQEAAHSFDANAEIANQQPIQSIGNIDPISEDDECFKTMCVDGEVHQKVFLDTYRLQWYLWRNINMTAELFRQLATHGVLQLYQVAYVARAQLDVTKCGRLLMLLKAKKDQFGAFLQALNDANQGSLVREFKRQFLHGEDAWPSNACLKLDDCKWLTREATCQEVEWEHKWNRTWKHLPRTTDELLLDLSMPRHARVLLRKYNMLVERLDMSSGLADLLYEVEAIDEELHQEMTNARSSPAAVRILLDHLIGQPELTYQLFLESLHQLNQTDLIEELETCTIAVHQPEDEEFTEAGPESDHNKVLRQLRYHYNNLVKGLNVSRELLAELLKRNVINTIQKENIEAESKSDARARAILGIVKRKDSFTFCIFLEALVAAGQ